MGLLDRFRRTSRSERLDPAAPDALVPHLAVHTEREGAIWTYEDTSWEELSDGNGPTGVEDQFIVLSMLAEQGRAELTEQGFAMTALEMAGLSDDLATLLGLPAFYQHRFDARMRGNTTSDRFEFFLRPLRKDHPEPYTRSGAIMTVGDDAYRLTPPLLQALTAIEAFQDVPPTERRQDVDNVRLIASLQDAEQASETFVPFTLAEDEATDSETDRPTSSWGIDLGHLQKFTTFRPTDVRLAVEPQADGSLRLWPDTGTGHRPEDLMATMASGTLDQEAGVIRHGSDLIVLDEGPMEAVREITRVGRIPSDRVQDFYASPASFIDQDKVNLELNFSVRVRSIGTLVPLSMAQISVNGLNWVEDIDGVLDPEALVDLAQDEGSLAEIEAAVAIAEEYDAPVAAVQEQVFDVADRERTRRALAEATERVRRLQADAPETPEKTVQIGIHLHEPVLREHPLSRRAAEAVLSTPVDYSGLDRTPYPHQVEGIDWITRLAEASLSGPMEDATRIQGALLADDMGLGKTFMALTALREFQCMQSRRSVPVAPTLIVVPLTLIENWEEEIASTFADSPFRDVVVLQADRDLPFFRFHHAGRESRADIQRLDSTGTLHAEDIMFSLAVGKNAGEDRLDQPGRVVIATYETLTAYQLSLGQVDWGMVIFDEAQRIKNPETLAARAAKGLKARFKLVATGTPVENKLMDLWSLMDTAQVGLLGTWPEFRQRWSRPIEAGAPEEQQEHGRQLADLIRPFMLRRIKEEHLPDLPTKTMHSGLAGEGLTEDAELHRTMPANQAAEYRNTMARHQTRAKTKGGSLKTLQALKSISLHPHASRPADSPPGELDWEDGARLSATFDVLDRVRGRGEKAIVFIINKAVQRQLALWIHTRYGLHVDIINGETSAMSRGSSSSRRGLVQKFQSRPGFGVIIMSPLAAGTGLTVTEANHAIHLERHWNPAKEAQATDRIYRIGQTKDVHVYLPMAIHPDPSIPSFDVNLHQLLQQKSDLKDAVVVPEIDRQDLMRSLSI